jgi:hypothetical protein
MFGNARQEQKNYPATLFLLVQHLHLANYGEVKIVWESEVCNSKN